MYIFFLFFRFFVGKSRVKLIFIYEGCCEFKLNVICLVYSMVLMYVKYKYRFINMIVKGYGDIYNDNDV